MTSDDFLAQVTGTEAKAEQMMTDAETAKRTKLEEKSFSLNKEREVKYAEVRKKGEERLAKKKESVGSELKSHLAKGLAEAKKLKEGSESSIAGSIPDAQQFLIGLL